MDPYPEKLFKKALLLECLTIAWNVFEGVASVTVGLLSGSIALFAYGLESSVEVFASSVVVWELKGQGGVKRTEKALKLIGVAYLFVSAYIFFDATNSLIEGKHPQATGIGITLMVVTFLVMESLGFLKKFTGQKMKSDTVLADAKFTIIDGLLSVTVLVGLVFNYFFGFGWMDQALALFLSGVAFREGVREIL